MAVKLDENTIIRPFERMAVEFLDAVSGAATESTLALILASPLSARNPDVCLLWHDGYRKKHRVALLRNLAVGTVYGFLKGAAKLAVNFKPLKYAVHGKINGSLLVVPSTCGHTTSAGTYKTGYVRTDDDDGIFVCGPAGACGKDEKSTEGITPGYKLSVALGLMRSGMHAFIRVKGGFADKTLLLLLWLEWAGSLQWLYACSLERALSEVVEKYDIKKIGCIHEMHFHARVVWRVASKYNARGYAVQHASISSGKRWYFCYPEERKNGLMLPDVMYVFSNDAIKLLAPYYSTTKFLLGCSERFSHWKDAAADGERKGDYYLFVSALAAFDNDVVIEELRKLIENAARPMNVRLRLHPHAEIGHADKKWIKSHLQKGFIGVSTGVSLKDDIARALAVVGMSTTVLEEALLLGCPAVQLTHPDYLQYIDLHGIKGAAAIGSQDLSAEYLAAVSTNKVDCEPLRERLGLNQPTVTYRKLFEA
jgi:hypothetical protein